MARSRTSPAAEPLDDDDLLAEILLRLPPQPSSLPRASLVCKRWRSIATDAAFRRRFRTHHLGVFEEHPRELKFMPLLDPPDGIPSDRFSLDLSADKFFAWRVLGCRHGREFVRDGFTTANAAVLCAVRDDQDHVHGDCYLGPFMVVLVGTRRQQHSAFACVYSSETGTWGDVASTVEPSISTLSILPCTLIGTALYWRLHRCNHILEFDLDNQTLTLISKPPAVSPLGSQTWIIRAEDGGLGLFILSYPRIQMWDRNVDCHGVASWVLRKNGNMSELLGTKTISATIVGYAEDADAVFMSMYKGSCMHVLTIVQLESMIVKECHGCFSSDIYHPLTNLYTAGN
ncbi:unnamed protein product [Alopecurus aequalis]